MPSACCSRPVSLHLAHSHSHWFRSCWEVVLSGKSSHASLLTYHSGPRGSDLLKAPCQHPTFLQGALSMMWLYLCVIYVHLSSCCTWRSMKGGAVSVWLPVALWAPSTESIQCIRTQHLFVAWTSGSITFLDARCKFQMCKNPHAIEIVLEGEARKLDHDGSWTWSGKVWVVPSFRHVSSKGVC